MTNTAARSNAKTSVLFVEVGGTATHTDKAHGDGFGAWAKMVNRASVALTGWNTSDTRCAGWADDKVTFSNRRTGEVRTFSVLTAK